MKQLFEILKERKNTDTVIAAVIDTEGSVPGKTGAYMLVGREGRIYGTVGGGKLEYLAILKAQEVLRNKENTVWDINTSDIGTVCGGIVKILFYYADEYIGEKGIAAHNSGKPYWLMLPLCSGRASISYDIESNEYCFTDDKYYYEKFNYDGMVYVFGGGHLSQETVPLLAHTGFRVTVIDDREEYADKKLFPDADNVLCSDYDSIDIQVNENDYIAIMTRGHMGDAECERFALGTKASYIGVVGSRAKTKYINDMLMAEGITPEQLKRVTTPIGLDIGSRTPAEIAISICAQLIKIRAEKFKK